MAIVASSPLVPEPAMSTADHFSGSSPCTRRSRSRTSSCRSKYSGSRWHIWAEAAASITRRETFVGPGFRRIVFFAIGVYGGAIQAGVGIALIFALAYAGDDLVRANSVKVVIVAALTLIALPVFLVQDQIAWIPGLVMGLGFAAGGALGTRLAIRAGERLIRPIFAACVIALAGRMVGLF